MDSKLQMLVIIVTFALLAYRLYQKFGKKETGKFFFNKKSKENLSSGKAEDDYEPYSKKLN
jgi:hypothetical protein